ncbi:F0F1 ATP synthase subunit delta [Brevundimonas sp. 2R-24]|uniref:ATP synthase subunit delta n=1 Tax=Peiella sedimenti TaxID=3061083 RepID=A0ABT8SLW4_9CAUL|nr:F0F1 ATP synthase subunit delta [Caulobacteraceae bacterium XZ-24]
MADDFKTSEVGERYAQALFDLALEEGALDAVRADLKGLKAALDGSADLRRLIGSPTFSSEDKGRGLVAVAAARGSTMTTAKFLGLLAQNGRAGALPGVIASFEKKWAAHTGVVSAEVTSAAALSHAQLAQVTSALRQALGKDPELSLRVDPALLGGLKIKIGSRLYDASLKTRLDQMKFALKRA